MFLVGNDATPFGRLECLLVIVYGRKHHMSMVGCWLRVPANKLVRHTPRVRPIGTQAGGGEKDRSGVKEAEHEALTREKEPKASNGEKDQAPEIMKCLETA